MQRWLIPLALVACSKHSPAIDPSSASVASPLPSPTTPNDHKASAAAIYDATNYVAPAELAYSRTLRSVIYPACHGGEGPGEGCSLAGFDSAGASFDVDPAVQVSWRRFSGVNKDRQAVIDKLVATLDKLDTVRLDRRPWTGNAVLELPDYGLMLWNPTDKALIATRAGHTSNVTVEWGDRGGPVNVFWSPRVAVVQFRMNPASGGRESVKEGYVVMIQLVVVPRP